MSFWSFYVNFEQVIVSWEVFFVYCSIVFTCFTFYFVVAVVVVVFVYLFYYFFHFFSWLFRIEKLDDKIDATMKVKKNDLDENIYPIGYICVAKFSVDNRYVYTCKIAFLVT